MLVNHQSRAQPLIALSAATQEALWLQSILSEFKINSNLPINIYCDNQSAIKLTYNPLFHKRTKHIDIKYHFIRNHIINNKINIIKINTKNNIADVLTKNTSKKINNKLFPFLIGYKSIEENIEEDLKENN